MPNIKSAKKELRKSGKRQAANIKTMDKVKDLIKKNLKAVSAKDKKVVEDFKLTMKALDKAVKKGLLKPNTANRKKSKLQKKVNQAKK